MKLNQVDDLVAEVLCDYAILRAQIMGLCDLLVRRKILSSDDLTAFLNRYTTRHRPKVTKEFIKHRLKDVGFSDSYIRDAMRSFEQKRPSSRKPKTKARVAPSKPRLVKRGRK